VFPRPEIQVLLEKMVLVKVDATSSNEKTDALLKKFGVVGLPTLIILSPDGNELTELRMVGDVTPALLAGHLSNALH
ncbi:MAG: protein-disulfide reductase DsbD, partial [Candidatus Riflebacteria bacterium]